MILTAFERLIALDKAMFLSINGGWSLPVLDPVMVFITLFGNGLFLAVAVVPVLYFVDRDRFIARAPVIVMAVVLGAAANSVFKEVVGRPRPLAEFSDEIRAGTVWVHTILEQWRAKSFPSGHAQTAFGAATALAFYYRGWYVLLFFVLAAGVAVSRVYLGVHFPLDVAAGALIGILCSLGMCMGWEKGKDRYTDRKKTDTPA